MNAPDEFTADFERLAVRIEWFQFIARNGSGDIADYEELGRHMNDFVARWGTRQRDSDQVQALRRVAANIRNALVLDAIAFRSAVRLALSLRQGLLASENLFAVEREMFRDVQALAPDERRRAEELLGPPERTLGAGYHGVEAAEAELEAQLAKMRDTWPERANDAFARRVRKADDDALTAWMAEVEAEIARIKAAHGTGTHERV